MNEVIKEYIRRKNPRTVQEHDRVLRELIQNISLLGLWRSGFFEHAAFYGGTALRIVHDLPRFSEDVDFSLLKEKSGFSLDSYFSGIKTELSGFGFETVITETKKDFSTIESAFIKANTRVHLLKISADPSISHFVPANQLLKVKLEVDTAPPGLFSTEVIPLLDPIPFYIRIFSLPDLFAGKMHCVLCRNWKKRVKGRDWYDMIWFLRKEIPLHLAHLEQRMRQSGNWIGKKPLEQKNFIALYSKRTNEIDFSQAASDVLPFIRNPRELDIWGRDFFLALSERFTFI
jgi:predicted nucleotidyltransferase component of viral defense system